MSEEQEFRQFICEYMARRSAAYEKYTQELLRHLSTTVEAIKEFVNIIGVDTESLMFKDVETLRDLFVFVVTGIKRNTTPKGVIITDVMFTVQVPVEVVFKNNQQVIQEFLHNSQIGTVEELYEYPTREDEEQPAFANRKKVLH